MEIVEKNKVTVFRFDGQYGASYSIGLSKKTQDGKQEYGYMPVRFKKDVELENKAQIYIKSAWLSFNVKDKRTFPFIFINEFTTINETKEKIKKEEKIDNMEIYEDFGKEIELNQEDLPF